MKNEGIRILFGISGLKVHSKLCMISRREKGKLVRYCSIGTGNMNEDTAKLYTDCNLLTADQDICNEVSNLFDFLERNIHYNGAFEHLLVSPVNARERLIALIDFEIRQARLGRPAWLKVKINNLADKQIGEKLYEAGQAGVKIQMICRSRFTIIPKKEETGGNIEAVSIVDKYLEHSRFFIFNHDGEELTFIGSADWQTRNIDRRVEVTCPINRPKLKKQLREIFEIQWSDNYKARIIDPNLTNKMKPRKKDEKIIRSQDAVYDYLLKQN